jgi:hypothetical protein
MTQSDAISQDDRSAKQAVLVLAAVVVVLALLNLGIAWLDPSLDWLEILAIGVWVFEPTLFGIWTALGGGALVTRLPLAVPCLLMLWIAPGLNKATFAGMERYEFIIIVCAGLTIFALAMLICLVVRWLTGCRIEHANAAKTIGTARVQFSLKYLLTTVTLWAVVLGMAAQLTFRAKPPPPSFFNFGGAEFYLYVSFLGGAVVSAVLLPINAVPVVLLRPQFSLRAVRFAIAAWFVVTMLATGIFAYLNKSEMNPLLDVLWEQFFAVLLLQLGATVVGLLVVLPLRRAGFRLISGRPADMHAPVSSPSVTQ